MVELADIFHRYGPAYREKYGDRMLPSHRQAMQDIEQCRTEALGGHVYYCEHCDETHYRFHSCQNRHCPKCQTEAAQQWLAQQQNSLLPGPYFLVTFTLPAELREVARSQQKSVYHLLFRTSAAALQELALDPRFVGGQIGMIGVLHTWSRTLHYHPHVHYLVPAGGIAPDGRSWLSSSRDFLVHVKPLSILFRAKFRDALKKGGLLDQVPSRVWKQPWVVHSQSVGNGTSALKYLARYLFRVAISNQRILNMADGKVTFEYQDSDTDEAKTCTLPAEEFIRRFLQHVLPKGFVKVRYFGYYSPAKRQVLKQVRILLLLGSPAQQVAILPADSVPSDSAFRCPKCGQAMRLVEIVRPNSRCPP